MRRCLLFIPMYNCGPQIGRVLSQLQKDGVADHFEGVACIDNGSSDDTVEAAIRGLETVPISKRAVLVNRDNYNLGGSHKVAIAHALDHGYTHLTVLHGDDQGSVDDLVDNLPENGDAGVDCLLGARFMTGSRLDGYSPLRTAANRAFNGLFSMAARHRLYDLGSGLNMYRVEIFRDNFHIRFPDDLTFNYYLILATCARKHSHRFFPLRWREDDQVSNARLFRQGCRMLRLLAGRTLQGRQFLEAEHREIVREQYDSTPVQTWGTWP
ncbi:glycosyltransferase family 2 protein [Maioricimonas sp. JC845]|uniref:glycosyltransferase family 2 protein n=1 Tax=Maioricimonas sp. JC845 TaxID=3232138 RepID=UPI00345943E8